MFRDLSFEHPALSFCLCKPVGKVLLFLFASDSAFGAGLFDYLLGYLAGDRVVVGELHVIRAARARD
jgi:ABC-type cobalt transport system substrate-binding protein